MSCVGDDVAADAGEALKAADGKTLCFQGAESFVSPAFLPRLQLCAGFDLESTPDYVQRIVILVREVFIFEAFVFIRSVYIFPIGFSGGKAIANEGEINGRIIPEVCLVAAPAILGRGADSGFPGIKILAYMQSCL